MNAAPRNERKPFGILLIAGLYAFGAIVLLFSLLSIRPRSAGLLPNDMVCCQVLA